MGKRTKKSISDKIKTKLENLVKIKFPLEEVSKTESSVVVTNQSGEDSTDFESKKIAYKFSRDEVRKLIEPRTSISLWQSQYPSIFPVVENQQRHITAYLLGVQFEFKDPEEQELSFIGISQLYYIRERITDSGGDETFTLHDHLLRFPNINNTENNRYIRELGSLVSTEEKEKIFEVKEIPNTRFMLSDQSLSLIHI